MLPQGDHNSLFVNEIPKWGEPYPNILNRQSVLECLTDYILQVNYRGYRPDPRKMLAVSNLTGRRPCVMPPLPFARRFTTSSRGRSFPRKEPPG
ncbi:hypothetical protein [Geotalea toluenoxydans]|uniref:hypothetical protein n=1 Tax=Geotalea toluenoxydans TaxID=421624 RepID=UPI000AC68EB8|nr:hypothetical protein [Geotalea toluenoxydans]